MKLVEIFQLPPSKPKKKSAASIHSSRITPNEKRLKGRPRNIRLDELEKDLKIMGKSGGRRSWIGKSREEWYGRPWPYMGCRAKGRRILYSALAYELKSTKSIPV